MAVVVGGEGGITEEHAIFFLMIDMHRKDRESFRCLF